MDQEPSQGLQGKQLFLPNTMRREAFGSSFIDSGHDNIHKTTTITGNNAENTALVLGQPHCSGVIGISFWNGDHLHLLLLFNYYAEYTMRSLNVCCAISNSLMRLIKQGISCSGYSVLKGGLSKVHSYHCRSIHALSVELACLPCPMLNAEIHVWPLAQ